MGRKMRPLPCASGQSWGAYIIKECFSSAHPPSTAMFLRLGCRRCGPFVSVCLSSAPCPQHALSSLTPRGPLAFKTALYAGRLGLQAVWVFFSLVDHRAVSRSTRPSSGTPCSSTSSQPSSFRCQPRPRCSRRLTRASTPPSPMTQYTTTPTCLPRGSPAPMGTTVLSAKVCPLL